MRGFGGFNPSRAVFIGDSVTQGVVDGLVTEAQALPYLVSAAKRYSYVNSGVSGENAPGCLTRFDRSCLVHGPSMVSIGVGTNDFYYDVSTETYGDAVTEMVRQAQIAGARVTLWVPIYAQDATRDGNIAAYRTVMRGLAASLSCDLFDLYDDLVSLDGATQNSYYLEDPGEGVHLSAAGLAWAAGKVGSGAYTNSFLSA